MALRRRWLRRRLWGIDRFLAKQRLLESDAVAPDLVMPGPNRCLELINSGLGLREFRRLVGIETCRGTIRWS